MTEVLNVLKKDQGINLKELTNKEKLAVVNALRSRYKKATLLKIQDFSKSSYFYALHAANKSDKYQKIKEYIRKYLLRKL